MGFAARRARRVSVGACVAIAMLPAAAASGAPTTPALAPHSITAAGKPCTDDYRFVQGQGRSCHVDEGLWKVKLPNGAFSLTHGPDPRRAANPADNGQHGVFSPAVIPRDPVCATSNAFVAILARPSSGGDTGAAQETAQEYLDRIKHVNGILYQAAVESQASPPDGPGENFRFVCNGSNQVDVKVETLNITAAQGNFGSIQSALQNRGYNSGSLKYVVYWDANVGGGVAGQGAINDDDSDSPSNQNNHGSEYAINYNSDDEVLLHEMGHTVGAVQPGAPNATGVNKAAGNGWHCFQDFDVMCYNDGGDTDPGFLVGTCDVGAASFDHFDCGHDSYFDAQIGAGQGANAAQYLDTHWNIGDCYVVFLENGACGAGGAPPNDNFAAASSAASLPYASGVSTANATNEAGEPTPSCAAVGKTVWYRFTPTRDMTLIADTDGDAATPRSTFDTVLAAYSGTSLGALTELECNDDIDSGAGNTRSHIEFAATAGTTYYVQVGGSGVASGQLTFALRAQPQPPPNDRFTNAVTVNTLPFAEDDLPTADATSEDGEELQETGCAPIGKTAWYRYTPQEGERLTASTTSSDFDTVLVVWRGTALGELVKVGCNDDVNNAGGDLTSSVQWAGTPGATYYLQVGGFRGQTGEVTGDTAFGALDVSLSAVAIPPPLNDNFGAAAGISVLPFFASTGTQSASSELTEPSPTCSPIGRTIWYRFAPSQDMQVVADTLSSDFDTVLAVYRGTSMSALTEVACNDDIGASNPDSRVQFDAAAGQTYYFQVGGAGAASGTLSFNAAQIGGTNPNPNPDPEPQPPAMPPITPDPMPGPLPEPTPQPSATVSLVGSSRLPVSRSGMVRLRLVCSVLNDAPFCEGRATLSRSGKPIGSEPFDIDPAATRTAFIQLRRATRRTLRRRGTLRVSLGLRTSLDGVVLQNTHRTVRLRAPRRR